MKNFIDEQGNKSRKSRYYKIILVMLSLVVIAGVSWTLHKDGITVTEDRAYEEVGIEVDQEITDSGNTEESNRDDIGAEDSGAQNSDESGEFSSGSEDETESDVNNGTDSEKPEEDVPNQDESQPVVLPELTGNWPQDVIATAEALIGGKDNASDFTAFCLQYAQVSQNLIYPCSDAQTMQGRMSASVLFHEDSGESALAGDIAGYLDEQNSQALGIVLGVDQAQGTLKVVSGNLDSGVFRTDISMQSVLFTVSVNEAWDANVQNTEDKDEEIKEDIKDTPEDTIQEPDDEDTDNENPDDGNADDGDMDDENPDNVNADDGDTKDEDSDNVNADDGDTNDENPGAEDTVNDGETDTLLQLKDYITNVTFEKLEDNIWKPVGAGETVNNRDQIRIRVAYSMPEKTINSKEDKLYYQLPGGIKLTNPLSGDIKDVNGQETIGEFTISTDGQVVLSFKDEFAKGQAFDGNFQFTASADFSSAGENGEVSFGNGDSLTIKQNEDIGIDKTAGHLVEDTDGNSRIDYTVTVSTNNGTGNTVKITDWLNKTDGTKTDQIKAEYVRDTIVVKKITGNTSQIISESDYKMTVDEENTKITIENLPALKAGEKYQLCYTVKVPLENVPGANGSEGNGSGRVYNYVKTESGKLNAEKYEQVTYGVRISKTGKYDPKTGLITWKIVVNNPNPQTYFDGYILRDMLPEGTEIKGDVVVRANDSTIVARITGDQLVNGYQFTNFPSKQYTFTFTTTLPENFSGGSITNSATIEKGNAHFTASGTVNLTPGVWGLQKTFQETEDITETIGRAYWNAIVTNTTGAGVFTFKDSFGDAVDSDGNTLAGSHYGIASELQEAIRNRLVLTLTDGTELHYFGNEEYFVITYYDETGNTVAASDEQTHIKSFEITVNLGSAETLNPVRIFSLLRYPTRTDFTDVDLGKKVKFVNTAQLWSGEEKKGEDSADFDYKNFKRLEKKVSTDGGGSYTDGGSVDYKDISSGNSKQLFYQIEIMTEANETQEIVLKDELPQYTSYVSGSAEFYLDGTNQKIGTATEQNGILTFTISNYNTNQREHIIRITYAVDIGEKWQDASTVKVNYTNSVTWGNETSSTSTTVNRKAEEIQKSGVQLKDSNGKLTNRVRYTVILNPTGEELNNGKDMTVTDTMSITQGSSVVLDSSSVKLYYYKYENGEAQLSQEVDHGLYQILTPEGSESLRIKIPDKTACVLVYECIVDPGAVKLPTINNYAFLAGQWKSQVDNAVNQADASASAGNGQLILTKVDSYSGQVLEGAHFTIYQYNKDKNRWDNLGEKETVNGKLNMTVTTGGTDTLHPNILYKIVETKAPENYTLDSTPMYYIWKESDKTDEAVYLEASGLTNANDALIVNGENIEKTKVHFGIATALETASVKNTYSNLKVTKLWMDETNRPMEPPVDEIKVQLYRYTTDSSSKEAYGEVVILNKGNNWTYVWEGKNRLPETDENGEKYHYIVEEENPEFNWKVTYRNNDGIQTGEITIANTVCNTYTLPETGSTGTAPYTAAGLALMGASAVMYGWRQRRKKSER